MKKYQEIVPVDAIMDRGGELLHPDSKINISDWCRPVVINKKIVLFALGLLTGCVIGSIIVMAFYGYRLSRGMFMLQDMDIVMAEDSATEAYLNESPEIGIWALENYFDFFNVVIEQRTENQTTDEVENFFIDYQNKQE